MTSGSLKNNKSIFEDLNDDSQVPKYLQVVNLIISEIEKGVWKIGERLPSINETSEEYYIARDTVFKAYNELRQRGIIQSVPGKGYFVSKTNELEQLRILLLFNKLSHYRRIVYNSFIESFGENVTVDLHLHHLNTLKFKKLIEKNLGSYHYYVIIPHFNDFTINAQQVLATIPPEQLIILDRNIENLEGCFGSVVEDFELDIYSTLETGLNLLKKYQGIVLVLPTWSHQEIVIGFTRFCMKYDFKFKIISSMEHQSVQAGEAYIVVEETDLVEFIKRSHCQNLEIGKDVGVISYNEAPYKEVLCGGITVISTDFEKMGETAAQMILNKRNQKVKNPFRLICRKSL